MITAQDAERNKTIKQGEHNMNNTILVPQEIMQRSSTGSPDVIMARRVMDVKSWRTILYFHNFKIL